MKFSIYKDKRDGAARAFFSLTPAERGYLFFKAERVTNRVVVYLERLEGARPFIGDDGKFHIEVVTRVTL